MNTNKQLLKALTELASRVEWLLHYHETGATVTHWTDKQDISAPGSIANHNSLRDAYEKARKVIKDAQ